MSPRPRIVLTRQRERNREWAERLRAAGHDVVELPLVRYRALVAPGEAATDGYDWIVFTSPHAVDAFFALAPEIGGAGCACLGPGTARALGQTGREDALGIAARDGAEFAAAFVRRVDAPARVLLPGAARRLDEPRATLAKAGFAVTELAIYETRAVTPDELPEAAPGDDAVVFFASPSAVHAFVAAWDARPACVAIGETTARAAAGAKFPVATAATPDLEAMVRAAGLDPIPAPADPRSGQ